MNSSPTVQIRTKLAGFVIVTGICLALLAALESFIPGIAAWCSYLGNGCQETARYHIIGWPIALWGLFYYVLLGYFFLRNSKWLITAVMLGAGFELVLIKIMIMDAFFCVFCVANAVLLAVLWLRYIDRKKLWETTALVLVAFTIGSFLVSGKSAPNDTSGSDVSPEAVLATVGDQKITVADVEGPLTSPLYKAQKNIYELKDIALQTQINDLLLKQEAKERGISLDQLIAEIRGQIPPPSQSIIDQYYNSGLYRMWGQWQGTEQQIKEKIKEYIHIRDSNQLVLDHCQQLREDYPVKVFLKPPSLPLTKVRIEGAPTLGPSDAPVTVVEFSDYLCPICRKNHAIVKRLKEEYHGKVLWVFKDYPLDQHPGAKELAIAARCAQEQQAFWSYQDLLFSSQKPPTPQAALFYARELGLKMEKFQADLKKPELAKALEDSIAEARAAGIRSTPTFIINGKTITGSPSFEELSKAIDEALAEAEIIKSPLSQ